MWYQPQQYVGKTHLQGCGPPCEPHGNTRITNPAHPAVVSDGPSAPSVEAWWGDWKSRNLNPNTEVGEGRSVSVLAGAGVERCGACVYRRAATPPPAPSRRSRGAAARPRRPAPRARRPPPARGPPRSAPAARRRPRPPRPPPTATRPARAPFAARACLETEAWRCRVWPAMCCTRVRGC